ncbi:MAG TPA: endonuclease/exonuclease/phosphatase family protein [Acidimicrobiales bacterium]|nr:endonuclease/exonuclease/phosphatase family protein [Acidimicrobiales bacterium]
MRADRRYRVPAFVLLLLALFATVVAGTGTAAGVPGAPPPRPLRVATFNIHHGVGLDNVLDLERIAATVESTGVEVVGLQEVDVHFGARSDFVDQANWLADRLGMYVVFGANLNLDPLSAGAPRRQYGTAILSEHRIRESTNTLLPRPEGGEQRGLLEAHIRVRGLPVTVYNTHLQHDSQVERLAQIATIRDIIAGVDESVVVLGDLNATPGSPEIANLTEDLVDSWVTAGVGDGFTYDAATPHARIDYVMSSGDVVARTAAVVTADASDHLPVVVDLGLPGGGVVR